MPADAADQARLQRKSYITALKDWIENGAASKFVVPPDELRRLMWGADSGSLLAAAHFRLGLELDRLGRAGEAQAQFEEAKPLRPQSWSSKNPPWALEHPRKPPGPQFW